MPYDPNSDMGLSALSPTLSVYKQFVANNGSGKTAAEFLMQQGNSALAMLALKQDYLKNVADLQTKLAQQPQAAPPTVSEDFDAAIAQQDQQTHQALMAQMPQPVPGLPGMPNPAMDRANFAGGGIVAFADGGDVQHFAIGGLTTAEAAEYAQLKDKALRYSQMMGSGGIGAVAGMSFDRTRLNQLQDKINAAEYASALQRRAAIDPRAAMELRNLEASGALTAPAAAPTSPAPAAAPTPPAAPAATTKPDAGILAAANAATRDANARKAAAAAPKTTAPDYEDVVGQITGSVAPRSAYISEEIEQRKMLGVGDAADELEKVISKLRAEYEGPGADKKNIKQSIIEASARMMMGKGGFAEALGEAVGTGVTGYYGRKEKMKDAALGLAKSTYELNKAKEDFKLSAAKEGSSRYEAERKRIEDAEIRRQEHVERLEEIAAQSRAQRDVANIYTSGRAESAETTQFTAKVNKLKAIAASASDVMKTTALSDPVAYAAAKKRYDDAMNSLSAMQFGGVGGVGDVTSSGW
jgi:hypothetical protein